ncbi:MAG: amidohydrolase [Bacteroidota bacterium]
MEENRLKEYISLRKELHRHPEISGLEEHTAKRITDFLIKRDPDQLLEGLGGHGVAAVFDGQKDGPSVMIRCELDALPIEEANDFAHRSTKPGVSHKCGHDGHMVMVAALADWLAEEKKKLHGRVILLFQPAEENGAGALAVLEDPQFASIRPDYAFALHNLPGYPMHQILWGNGQFNPAVQSMAIHLRGKAAHAAEPHNGLNPAWAIADLIQTFAEWNVEDPLHEDFRLITPVHIKLGEKDYGISPGAGELHLTMRCWDTEKMVKLGSCIILKIIELSDQNRHNLLFETRNLDEFPAVINDDVCNQIIQKAAHENNFELVEMKPPCTFGEDFGHFSQRIPSAMFGLGAGQNTSALHHADYDFSDELLPTGIQMFQSIISEILSRESDT